MTRRRHTPNVEIAKGDRVRVYPKPVPELDCRRDWFSLILTLLVTATLLVWTLLVVVQWVCACLW